LIVRRFVITLCCIAAFGQNAPVTGTAFEVASVKPTVGPM